MYTQGLLTALDLPTSTKVGYFDALASFKDDPKGPGAKVITSNPAYVCGCYNVIPCLYAIAFCYVSTCCVMVH